MGLFKKDVKKNEEISDKERYLDTELDAAEKRLQETEEVIDGEAIINELTRQLKEVEQWIWVEGYKGLNPNMTANFGDEVFEVGTYFKLTGDISLCNYGYHFCLNLDDLILYRSVCTRIFKVRGLVRKKDYEQYGKYLYDTDEYFSRNGRINKIVAKTIILEEELSFDDIIKNNLWAERYKGALVETEADYKELLSMAETEMKFSGKEWYLHIFNKTLKPLLDESLSPTLSQIFRDMIVNKSTREDSSSKYGRRPIFNAKKFKEMMLYIEGLLKTEGISKDMIVYLLTHKIDTM